LEVVWLGADFNIYPFTNDRQVIHDDKIPGIKLTSPKKLVQRVNNHTSHLQRTPSLWQMQVFSGICFQLAAYDIDDVCIISDTTPMVIAD
jgi:hypothetical protein